MSRRRTRASTRVTTVVASSDEDAAPPPVTRVRVRLKHGEATLVSPAAAQRRRRRHGDSESEEVQVEEDDDAEVQVEEEEDDEEDSDTEEYVPSVAAKARRARRGSGRNEGRKRGKRAAEELQSSEEEEGGGEEGGEEEEEDEDDDAIIEVEEVESDEGEESDAVVVDDEEENGGESSEDEVPVVRRRRSSRRTTRSLRSTPSKRKKRRRGKPPARAKSQRAAAKGNASPAQPVAELTPEERKARLDQLVAQSESINRDLQEAICRGRKKSAGEGADGGKEGGEGGEKEGQREGAEKEGPKVAFDVVDEADVSLPVARGKKLQPHQVAGVKWLLELDGGGYNGILADEMGLGKTVQALSVLANVITVGRRGPHMIIAPLAVASHWSEEAEAWFPGVMKAYVHLGPAAERLERLSEALAEDDFDIFITSYDIALRDIFGPMPSSIGSSGGYRSELRRLRKTEFEYLVIDEAHRLKNPEAKLTKALRQYPRAGRRILLTGTPLSNKLDELWALLNVLNPAIFDSADTFQSWFSSPFQDGQNLSNSEKAIIVARMHTVLRPFFRRRVRADVCPGFSHADEVIVQCPPSPLQVSLQRYYQKVRRGYTNETTRGILIELRKCATHPWIVSDAFCNPGRLSDVDHLAGVSGKMLFLHYAMPRLLKAGHRVLIFAQLKMTLDLVGDLMDFLGISFFRLDGDTPAVERGPMLASFNKERPTTNVFLLSTRAGGVGINLQSADTVILAESDWNPSADLQAVSRIQRIGQKRTVHIMRLVTHRQIDEVIVQRARKKLRTQAVAVGAGKFSSGREDDVSLRQRDIEQLLGTLDAEAPLFAGRSEIDGSDDIIVVPGDGESAQAPTASGAHVVPGNGDSLPLGAQTAAPHGFPPPGHNVPAYASSSQPSVPAPGAHVLNARGAPNTLGGPSASSHEAGHPGHLMSAINNPSSRTPPPVGSTATLPHGNHYVPLHHPGHPAVGNGVSPAGQAHPSMSPGHYSAPMARAPGSTPYQQPPHSFTTPQVGFAGQAHAHIPGHAHNAGQAYNSGQAYNAGHAYSAGHAYNPAHAGGRPPAGYPPSSASTHPVPPNPSTLRQAARSVYGTTLASAFVPKLDRTSLVPHVSGEDGASLMKRYAKAWDPLLLRRGESSLPDMDDPVLALSGPDCVPPWLTDITGLNFVVSGLNSADPDEAVEAVRKAKLSGSALAGETKRSRAQRKTRFQISFEDLDVESSSDEEEISDESEDSDDDMPSDGSSPTKNRKQRKRRLVLPSDDDDEDDYRPSQEAPSSNASPASSRKGGMLKSGDGVFVFSSSSEEDEAMSTGAEDPDNTPDGLGTEAGRKGERRASSPRKRRRDSPDRASTGLGPREPLHGGSASNGKRPGGSSNGSNRTLTEKLKNMASRADASRSSPGAGRSSSDALITREPPRSPSNSSGSDIWIPMARSKAASSTKNVDVQEPSQQEKPGATSDNVFEHRRLSDRDSFASPRGSKDDHPENAAPSPKTSAGVVGVSRRLSCSPKRPSFASRRSPGFGVFSDDVVRLDDDPLLSSPDNRRSSEGRGYCRGDCPEEDDFMCAMTSPKSLFRSSSSKSPERDSKVDSPPGPPRERSSGTFLLKRLPPPVRRSKSLGPAKPVKRGRGRPRKHPKKPAELTTEVADDGTEVIVLE